MTFNSSDKRASRVKNRHRMHVERLESRRLLASDLAQGLIAQYKGIEQEVDFESVSVDSEAKFSPIAERIGDDLYSLHKAAQQPANSSALLNSTTQLATAQGLTLEQTGRVQVDVIASGGVTELKNDLALTSFEELGYFNNVVSGWIDADDLQTLAELSTVNFVKPVYAPVHNVGSVTSQADAAMRSNLARQNFGVDGSGIKIGVVSDSFNRKGGANSGINSGDLPGPGNPFGRTTPVQVLDEGPSGATDEGRAMLELIHDIAPEANLSFHTSGGSSAVMAQGFLDLANAGADVIVDDVTFLDQPFFQDGILAQAADQVAAAGIPFFSSAGNQGRGSYEALFRPGTNQTINIAGINGYVPHDFDPGPGVDLTQLIVVPPGRTMRFVFQWDEPFASAGGQGAGSDMDLFLFDSTGTVLAASSLSRNVGMDPIEGLIFLNDGADPFILQLVVAHFVPAGGTPSLIKYIDLGGPATEWEYPTFSSTVYQHHNASLGAGVGAAFYQDTPAFGTNPPQPEESTSRGGIPILFDTAGNRLNTAIVRQQPRITAPDGTNTTFFSPGVDPENDGFENFFGTSAAAPHAAAVAALMLQAAGGPGSLSPSTVYTTMQQTAIDMLAPGFDFDTGFGLLDAEAAVSAVATSTPSQKVFFTSLLSGQRELYATEGTANNTTLVRNLSGSNSSNPDELTVVNDTLFFTALTNQGHRELFKSDGTQAGTVQVANLRGNQNPFISDLTQVGNWVYFTALTSNGQRELYRSRGSAANTQLVRNLSGSVSSNPKNLTAVGNKLFFTAITSNGNRELFTSDGTTAGTRLVRNLAGQLSAAPGHLTRLGSQLYFSARINANERELYVTDGTSAGTQVVRNMAGSSSSDPKDLTAYKNKIYFSSVIANGSRELFSTDGTSAGTQIVQNLAGAADANVRSLTVAGGNLYFVADLANGQSELHRTTGSSASTRLVRNLAGNQSSNPQDLTAVGNLLAFTIRQPNGNRELYRSNGNSNGTFLVKDLNGNNDANPKALVAFDQQVVFAANRNNSEREVFISNLNRGNARLVKNLNGSNSAAPLSLTLGPAPAASASAQALNLATPIATSVTPAAAIPNASDIPPVGLPTASSSVFAWTNTSLPQDVNTDGFVTSIDALLVINHLNQHASVGLLDIEAGVDHLLDVSGDGAATALDALMIINDLNYAITLGEGESEPGPTADLFFADLEEERRRAAGR